MSWSTTVDRGGTCAKPTSPKRFSTSRRRSASSAAPQMLPQITTSVTVINGWHDSVVPLANAEFLDDRLPNSRLVILDTGHFVWEEAPAEYASIILESIRGTNSS
jgi:pimeloyl-ACP methyl ester carboxylesterase